MRKKCIRCLKGAAFLTMAIAGAVIVIPAIVLIISHFFSFGSQPEPISIHDKVEIPDTINIYRHASGIVETIPFEEYVAGVVAGEMPASFENNALKAQAVAARTYSLSKLVRSGDDGFPDAHTSAPLCDDIHCQVYLSPSELETLKSSQWMQHSWPLIEAAVFETSGELMYYEGELVHQALFHSSSGGSTENSEDVFVSAVPYLRSVSSPYESEATHQNEQTLILFSDLRSRLKTAFPSVAFGTLSPENVYIVSHTDGGRVKELRLGDASLSGSQIRTLLGLSSANFKLSVKTSGDDYVACFTTNGYGHGVGMSQYGANGMAKAGYSYKEILMHYYTGISVY